MANTPWVVLDVMPRMTVKFASSLAGGACVRLAKFQFGYGWISGNDSNYTLQVPPADVNAVPAKVYEGNFSASTLAVDGGKVIAKCVVPKASVSVPTRISAIVLIDNEGDVIGAGSFLPGWLVPDGEFEVDCVLEMKYERAVGE